MGEMWNTFMQILGKKNKSFYQLLSSLEPDDWSVYPRPQMRRARWQCLNGCWRIKDKTIRVPFPPQAELSGYSCESISEIPEELLYERTFRPDAELKKNPEDRIILHFGAVDQVTQIFINGRPVFSHEGGYLPFHVDITDYLKKDDQENLLSVFVQDHLDHKYPWGKQRKDRGGMWYTPCSGIWQTVWLETVPKHHIERLRLTPVNLHQIKVEVADRGEGSTETHYSIALESGETISGIMEKDRQTGNMSAMIELGEYAHKWTPDDPFLYPIVITMDKDRVESYFALRTVSIQEKNGMKWICLNNEPVFLSGVLDQGYFCDGLFLPANASGYEKDILGMKKLGFNMLRKHIKVEPEIFYYDCDRLGMLVMQDMVNNGPYTFLTDTGLPTIGFQWHVKRSFRGITGKQKETRSFFIRHSEETIEHLYNHPCVIAYTVFNEGWGQFDSDKAGDLLSSLDETRIFDYTSGWFKGKNSPVESIHEYFHPRVLKQTDRPVLLSECGGYTWQVEGHSYCISDNYGYGKCQGSEELTDRILSLYEQMIYPSISQGLCGIVYTQVSDVEDEVNGFYTYDRMVCKVNEEKIRKANEKACELIRQASGE